MARKVTSSNYNFNNNNSSQGKGKHAQKTRHTYINHFSFKYITIITLYKPSTTNKTSIPSQFNQQTHKAQQVNSQSKIILFQTHQAQQVNLHS